MKNYFTKKYRNIYFISFIIITIVLLGALLFYRPAIEGFWAYGPEPLDGGVHYMEFKDNKIYNYSYDLRLKKQEKILNALIKNKEVVGSYKIKGREIWGWIDAEDNGKYIFRVNYIYPWNYFSTTGYFPDKNRFFTMEFKKVHLKYSKLISEQSTSVKRSVGVQRVPGAE